VRKFKFEKNSKFCRSTFGCILRKCIYLKVLIRKSFIGSLSTVTDFTRGFYNPRAFAEQ